ncbi:MAG: cobaltochelatase subunit CobN [Phenylobacterium sp.]|uniref:cobaltochelatase subunit CobN n=1 Tax=Phenylobacterium sp. TaxID=1871053 RepID=UPI00271B9263|nr:cobaltochelatase subunit CobN [Phenylobacterium sp.]MDO8901553.1 cobaltochelatase subunit CobN [Phenylobacterium sp.]
MRRARLWLAGLSLWLAAVLGPPALAATNDDGPLMRVITTDFVLPGKIERLRNLAEAEGLGLDGVWVETDERPAEAWFDGADLILIDTPRANDLAKVMGRLEGGLEDAPVPWLRVGGGPPAFGGGLRPEAAARLSAYYANGGAANHQALFAYAAAMISGADLSGFPAPQALPASGIYHPDAARPFAAVADYLAWGQGRWAADAPRLGIITYGGAISSGETALLDALARSAEARGVAPVVFWFEAAQADAISQIAAPAGLDVLVNLQHLQNGGARKAEFEALGLPVLSGFVYREGDLAAWRASPTGLATQSTAVLLATPEAWGVSDPMVLATVDRGETRPIPAQVDALIAKAARLGALRNKANADKRLTLMFWNHPGGEKNLGASNLNVPRSLEALSARLAAEGYDVPPTEEQALISGAQALLGGYYRPETLDDLLARDLAATLPVAAYRAWLDAQAPEIGAAVRQRWGAPEDHWAVRRVAGEPHFVIPRLSLGKLTLMPQPPRADRPGESYHDTKVPPGHLYLAAYLLMREPLASDALIHFGTHGTQEWTPGKDRGLSVEDYPFLTVGDVPVFYPYIQDNVGEAIQARRRGRAVTISHQTPPFAPAGLYDELRDVHALVHEYGQLEDGPVRQRTAAQIAELTVREGIAQDIGWDGGRVAADFPDYMIELHDHLHALAASVTPLGLHTFGEPAAPEQRLLTVMQQLGRPYYQQLGLDADEVFAEDAEQIRQSEPYLLLQRQLREGEPPEAVADEALRALLARAAELDRHLAETGEMEALLAGLAGGFIAAGPGGDPVRNPDVPSGRNLFSFEPDKLPTLAAYIAGGEAFDRLQAAYVDQHGEPPRKLAFTLWSGEAVRTLGVVESQALHALGLRPVWDQGGRVVDLEIVPAAELGRPRVDVVFQITSVYRDQFDGFMRLLGGALTRLAALEEAGNTIAANSAKVEAQLIAAGQPADQARRLSAIRLFSNAPGDYGSGVPAAVLDSTAWESDGEVADRFLSRLQYAYGAEAWGETVEGTNLFAAQLSGVQAALLSRSSNLHGVLSTDHPFEYLGGLSMAIRKLDGASPDLFITDARGATPRVRTAASVLSDELRSRYLNPQWITAMQGEGYAGTLEILDVTNNLFGWQVTDPAMVRPDQWQAMHETFVMDRRKLGLNDWFEAHNPTAQAQLIERLTETIRKGYWTPDAETLAELSKRWSELTKAGAMAGEAATTALLSSGFGLSAQAPVAGAAAPQGQASPGEASPPEPAAEVAPAPPPVVRGQVLEKVQPPAPPTPLSHWRALLGLVALLTFTLIGAAGQAQSRPRSFLELSHARP